MESQTPPPQLLPESFRTDVTEVNQGTSSLLRVRLQALLYWIPKIASVKPVITICTIAAVASVCYSGLLEETFIDPSTSRTSSYWSNQLGKSSTFVAYAEDGWQWRTPDQAAFSRVNDTFLVDQRLSVLRLVLPESQEAKTENLNTLLSASLEGKDVTPRMMHVPAFPRLGTNLDIIVPDSQAITAFEAIEQLSPEPNEEQGSVTRDTWVPIISREPRRKTLQHWTRDSWQEFRKLFQHAQNADIFMMCVSYGTAMVPFIHLFLSMRRLGSNIWLAVGALFSSGFAFLFSLFVTAKAEVPVTLLILAEGTPFFIITVGFEKYVMLARSAFHYERLSYGGDDWTDAGKPGSSKPAPTSSSALMLAVKDTGLKLLAAYAAEIGVLLLGTVPGVAEGLRNFCIFAIWTLFFDLLLLFTFFVAILNIKLDVLKLKQYLDTREVLENDGVDTQVAESVAQVQNRYDSSPSNIFMSRRRISAFKIIMVVGFFLLNGLKLVTVPFKSISPLADYLREDLVNTEILKHHAEVLERILSESYNISHGIAATIFPPIHCVSLDGTDAMAPTKDFWSLVVRIAGITQAFENPLLSKLLLAALTLSVAFNSHILRTVSGEGNGYKQVKPVDAGDLDRAQRFNSVESIEDVMTIAKQPTRTDHISHQSQEIDTDVSTAVDRPATARSLDEMEEIAQAGRLGELDDDQIVTLALRGKIAGHALEAKLGDFVRAVRIRRSVIAQSPATADLTASLVRSKLPYHHYDWKRVLGACCENVIGYMPVPVGVAGPIVVDCRSYFLPMATTEGVLVASTSRGCKAINAGGGAITIITNDGMTRGPCLRFRSLGRGGAAKAWLDSSAGYAAMKKAFESTSRFIRLVSMKSALAGTELFVRFKATTGDAMGMNMISKGVEYALKSMMEEGFEDMEVVSVSGNYCTDKKAAAINWLDGRGKSVVAEAVIPAEVVKAVLKTDVETMVQLNISKNLVGSAMAGSVGGFNAHAANIVAALFIATGQDPAQVVESSNCITTMHNVEGSLKICVSMPSIEVGTLGGGTILEPQAAMLDMLGVRGPSPDNPGENARQLARLIGAATLAGELSLCSALAAGHLVKSHLQHNRSK
ncbi:unnamed protein product [Cercospora beticola]|nr:unnamed protein product [Cercospora beticola]